MIPFQFSITQGLSLEFGEQYMRVVFNGSFVTEPAITITGVSEAVPAVVSATANGVTSATVASNTAVTQTYAPGDTVTVAGGNYSTPAVLAVATTTLLAISVNEPGTSGEYAPADTITLAGGTASPAAVATVQSTQVLQVSVVSGGTGGPSGATTGIMEGTTGTGTKVLVECNLLFGGVQSIIGIVEAGNYTVNPAVPSAEPMGGNGIGGCTFNLTMGVLSVDVTTHGVFTQNPPGGNMTQASTSGSGVGATFYFAIFGVNTVTVSAHGVYFSTPPNPVSQLSTSGVGLGATFTLSYGAVDAFNNGDWVYLSGIIGPTQLNNQTYVVEGSTTSGFELYDIYGNAIDTTSGPAYVSGGTAARIYTLSTIWNEQDLPWLKYSQSADVMSICCVNQLTGTEYPPQDLERFNDYFWTLTQASPVTSIDPPTAVTCIASTTGTVNYEYCVTALAADGTESIASVAGEVGGAVDIAATAGTITVTWNAVPKNYGFYIYKFPPGYGAPIPAGSLPGFVGQSNGNQFIDNNIVPDYQQVPPTHLDPFANGQILEVNTVVQGTGYVDAELNITTSTGSGFSATPVIVDSSITAWIINNAGQNYASTDTGTVIGSGTGATVALVVGSQSGNYPSVVNYFQERRTYANSQNNPDTYWLSQPGAYLNFDARVPPIPSDAITGTPWGVQVNGIQWLIQTSGGLLVMTGLSAWLLVGAGSFATNVQPISPTNQDAVVQAFTGVSPLVVPIRINYDVIYVESKGSYYYDLPYQLYALSEPIDLTEISTHLFTNFTILENAWCEQPNKLLWAVRSDGVLLSLTYYKSQQISGWARHDTQGMFVSVCSIVEPPVDALYVATERFLNAGTTYLVERMNNRQWDTLEDAWCVDCAIEYPLTYPNATVSASSPGGEITGSTGLVGGNGYSAGTTFTVVDANGEGPGTGAVVTGTISGGEVTGLTVVSQGSGYTAPAVYASDPAGSDGGSGFNATLTLNTSVTFTASTSIFSSGNIGSVLRMGGGIANITAYTNGTTLTGELTIPISDVIVDGSATSPRPQSPNNWSLTQPITHVTGLEHLANEYVTGLADGQVIPLTQVSTAGTLTLSTPASRIIIGLPFVAQLQTIRLDAGSPTVQGQRKKIAAATIRVEASAAFESGENQPDGATFSPLQLAPQWNNLNVVPNKSIPYFGNPTLPLYTGDVRVILGSDFATRGQVAIEQNLPLPLSILALIPEILPGDIPDLQIKDKGKRS